MTDNDQNVPLASPLQALLRLLADGLLGVFALGWVAGLIAAANKHNGFSFKSAALFLVPLILVTAAWWIVKPALKASRLPKGPRTRRAQFALYGGVALGIVTGLLLGFNLKHYHSGPLAIFTAESKLAPLIVAGILASTLVGCWLSVLWLRNIDEHERAAHDFGAVLSLYGYVALSVGWWALWRGGVVNAPDGLVIFCAIMVIWTVGWLYRRFT